MAGFFVFLESSFVFFSAFMSYNINEYCSVNIGGNMDNNCREERLLQQFEPLLHKTLSQLNIRPSQSNYDDYLQELRIKLLQLSDKFIGDPFGDKIGRFITFARKGLFYYMIDIFRKENKIKNEIPMDISKISFIKEEESYVGQQDNIQSFIQEAEELLTPKEKDIFHLLIQSSYTMQEIANILGVSRNNIHKYKKQIRKKLTPLKFFLGF